MSDANLQSLIADRRRQWSELSAPQQMHRVQSAIVGTLDYARWRRQEARRRTAARLAQQPEKVVEYDRL